VQFARNINGRSRQVSGFTNRRRPFGAACLAMRHCDVPRRDGARLKRGELEAWARASARPYPCVGTKKTGGMPGVGVDHARYLKFDLSRLYAIAAPKS
jgi:hypothetical protein